jgi:hypothetical protein
VRSKLISPASASTLFRPLLWAVILSAVAVVSVSVSYFPMETVGFSVSILVAGVVALRATPRGGIPGTTWIPLAWVALMVASDLRFDRFAGRTPIDATEGDVSLSIALELVIYAAVFGMIVYSRSQFLRSSRSDIPRAALLVFPCFALASSLWSVIPLFTIARATELLVIASLALLSVRIWRFSAELGESVWRHTMRAYVQVVSLFTLVGFVIRVWPEGRFSWPGYHPGQASTYAAAALLILVIGGRSFAPRPGWTYWLRLPLLAAATFLGQTRSVLAALVVGGLAALWAMGRQKPIVRYVGIAYYFVGFVVLVGLFWGQLVAYLSRGQGSSAFTTFNSRIPLWQVAIDEVFGAGRWVHGFGYGASRVILFPRFEWAGTAHNAWIEAMMGLGLVGVGLLVGSVLLALWRLGGPRNDDVYSRLSLVLLTFLLVISVASETMILPGFGSCLLALTQVPSLRVWGRDQVDAVASRNSIRGPTPPAADRDGVPAPTRR